MATITPFLPDPAKASGAAVVVAPGGGFRTLSMEMRVVEVRRGELKVLLRDVHRKTNCPSMMPQA